MKYRHILFATCTAIFFSMLTGCAGPARYEPSAGQGPLVLMISGISGPTLYSEFAKRLAHSGYRVILFDGNDFPIDRPDACRAKILKIIKDQSPDATAKAAVVGYSLGGAVALSCAASLPDHVAAVIAYYPATRFITDQNACIDGLRVPLLVLQGEDDNYFNCCRVEIISGMLEKAREKGRDVELIVYPHAGHGFNLGPMKNKELDADSWRRTMESLKKYLFGISDAKS